MYEDVVNGKAWAVGEEVRTQHGKKQDGKETYKGHRTAWSAETMRSVKRGDDMIDVLKEVRGHRVEAASFRRATTWRCRARDFHQSCHQ